MMVREMRPSIVMQGDTPMELPGINGSDVDRFIVAMREQYGLDLAQYERSFLERRIMVLLLDQDVASCEAYLELLNREPATLERLYAALYINQTGFFRDPQAWEYLRHEVLAGLLQRKRSADDLQFHAWSAGCASGEEPYSLAILLRDMLDDDARHWDVRIFATDANAEQLHKAQHATYTTEELQELPQRYTSYIHRTEDGRYQMGAGIRQLVWYQQENLFNTERHAPMDLILCRNVMIYFARAIQEELKQRFVMTLRPGGYLFLGAAEVMLGDMRNPFDQLSGEHKIYQRRRSTS